MQVSARGWLNLNSTVVTTEDIVFCPKYRRKVYLNSTVVTTEEFAEMTAAYAEAYLNSTVVTTEAEEEGYIPSNPFKFKFYCSNN